MIIFVKKYSKFRIIIEYIQQILAKITKEYAMIYCMHKWARSFLPRREHLRVSSPHQQRRLPMRQALTGTPLHLLQ